MGARKIIVKQSAADNISAISWFIESKGLIGTANKLRMTRMIFLLKLPIRCDLTQFAEILPGQF